MGKAQDFVDRDDVRKHVEAALKEALEGNMGSHPIPEGGEENVWMDSVTVESFTLIEKQGSECTFRV